MVKWSIPAKIELKHIHDYIAQDSTYYAKKVAEQILDKSLELQKFPETGRRGGQSCLPPRDGRSSAVPASRHRPKACCSNENSRQAVVERCHSLGYLRCTRRRNVVLCTVRLSRGWAFRIPAHSIDIL